MSVSNKPSKELTKIDSLHAAINDLREQKKGRLSGEQMQLINDRITEIRAEIDLITRPEKRVVPVVNAPIVVQRKEPVPSSMGTNRAFI